MTDLKQVVANVIESHLDDWDAESRFAPQRDRMAAAVLEAIEQEFQDAIRDRLILTLRLLGEPEGSHAPETVEVLDRMRPIAMELLQFGGTMDQFLDQWKTPSPA